SGPTTLIARDGTNRPIDDSAAPMRDASGAVLGAVLVFRDITERKQAEARALQAERLAAIGEIVTGLAHESRNALQRGQACLEMLALEVPDRPRARELIARLQRAQDDLSGLYEEVREYAAPIRLQLRDCNLAEVWRDAWTDLEPARQGRVAVLHEVIEVEDLCGRIDAPRMGQVFRNLLENALIACSDPVEIAIRCGPDDLDGRPAMRISVRDDGPGFTAEEGPKVFEAFYTTKTRGTGLGLTICRRIVEAHEGRIISADPPGRGAEFILILPRAACSEQRTPSAEPHPSV
ncbi:MAG: kinE 1, partial [Planctomycetota bacterium]|nr:kinE 1 [Planctomycetota bacterium]